MEKLFILIILFLTSCKGQNDKVIKTLVIDTSKDKQCLYMVKQSDTVKFSRNLKIIENSINDTILLGNTVLAPKQLGAFEYTQYLDRTDIILDLRYKNLPADRVCTHAYKDKLAKGELKIRLEILD